MSGLPLVAIRPEPGLGRTIALGREMGLAIEGFPLFTVRPVAWDAPDPADYDALLVGSGNALRHAGEPLRAFAGLPVYAVGEETAAAARGAGFRVERTGPGSLQPLLAGLSGESLRLLRLAGQAHVPVDVPPGIAVTTRIVYAVDGLPFPAALAECLGQGTVVLLHSGEAAAHFAAECDRLGLARGRIAIAALAPRIAGRAGDGWRAVGIAESPGDAALLAAAAPMCKEGYRGAPRHFCQEGNGT